MDRTAIALGPADGESLLFAVLAGAAACFEIARFAQATLDFTAKRLDPLAIDAGHGGIERLTDTIIHDVAWLQNTHGGPWDGVLNAAPPGYIVRTASSRGRRGESCHSTA